MERPAEAARTPTLERHEARSAAVKKPGGLFGPARNTTFGADTDGTC